MGFTYFIWNMLGGSGVSAPVVTPPPHVCQPTGFLPTGSFNQLELSGNFTQFHLTNSGVNEWAEDC